MAGTRITQSEYDERVRRCYKLRYEEEKPIGVKKWIEICEKDYPEKTGPTYTKMWADAGKLYEEGWRTKLSNMLGPATDELFRLLASEDEKVKQRAIDQIMKYNGEDIQKIQADIKGDIKIRFGEDDA